MSSVDIDKIIDVIKSTEVSLRIINSCGYNGSNPASSAVAMLRVASLQPHLLSYDANIRIIQKLKKQVDEIWSMARISLLTAGLDISKNSNLYQILEELHNIAINSWPRECAKGSDYQNYLIALIECSYYARCKANRNRRLKTTEPIINEDRMYDLIFLENKNSIFDLGGKLGQLAQGMLFENVHAFQTGEIIDISLSKSEAEKGDHTERRQRLIKQISIIVGIKDES